MAELVLKSERQVQTQILARLIAELGLNDINPGSVIDILTQAIAQQDFALYYQIGQLSRLNNIDALSGDDLDLKAFEFGITRFQAEKATGQITIQRPEGFEKVSTTFFAGSPSPLSGDLQIDVNDASSPLIGSSGTLILGRGSNNEEEVTYSSAPVNNTSFFRYTLDAALQNNHTVEETIILKQGNDEIILAGTIVSVPATGTTEEIQFTINNDITLQAGEDVVENVDVTAVLAGADGNITASAIEGEEAFTSPPFTGARATNPSKFTTGRDRETDDELRDRIKETIPGLSRGVKQAIQNAIVGLVDTETAKRVVSASIVLPVDECDAVEVYIDDGTGFEPSFESQGFETIKQNSTGGEERLQLDQFPIVKAQIENNTPDTYDMSAGTLSFEYQVANESETINFEPSDFRFPDIATAEEIVAAINDKSTLLEARTSQSGAFIVITAKRDINESIQVTGGAANNILNFPTDRKETINLYIDDVQISKDGETAVLDSGNTAPYNLLAVGAFPHTLDLVVDGKTSNPQTATINLADVGDPAAVTVAEIIAVLNRDIAGITAVASFSDTRVRIESNTKLSVSSQLQITGGTMNDATNGLNFDTNPKVGIDGDYTFNRELGIIQLGAPLGLNQTVTAGSIFTRGKLRAAIPENYTPANGETLVISVDGAADQTITFDGSFAAGLSAQLTADFINQQLQGAVAIAREIGTNTFLEINTNTFETSGSIEIKSTSTGNNAFAFELDTPQQSGDPNKAFVVSTNSGPFDFAQDDSLVVVIDNDIVNSAYNILLNFASTVSAASANNVFQASGLSQVFESDDELNNFYVAFTSGDNTTSETVTTVADQGGGVFRYTFGTPPPNFADFGVNDLARITDLNDSENNGNFLISAVGLDYIDVVNPQGVNASAQTGTGLLSQRRQIIDYVQASGEITAGAAFRAVPAIADPLIVIPASIKNLVDYINNTKITSFTLKGNAEGVQGFTKLQLSSKQNGSDGFVQVTGGEANEVLGFEEEIVRGVQAYSYFTGLTKLVHRTIYGDDNDLVSFPGVGAAGIIFRVKAPTTRNLNIQLNVTLSEGVSLASVENEIKTAVTGYVNNLGLDQDVVAEEIRAAVIKIAGIIDVILDEPTDNIAIAENEIGRVDDTDILIG